jgi:membrane dipeptidase
MVIFMFLSDNDLPWFFHDLEPSGPSGLHSVDLRKNNRGIAMRGPHHACLHTDIPRLREGGVGWQFWSVYTPATDIGPVAVQTTLEQIDMVHRLVDIYPDVFELAYSAEDVRRIFASGKIASMMGMEGGHQINCSMASLRMFYKLGVRYMTLTHNGGPSWADAALSIFGEFLHDAPNNGLSPFGKEVVLEMNRVGMLVDLSHVHHLTMKAALHTSRAPVIFSHSSTRALCDHPRDVPDDILRMLPANGGVVMITFVSAFVAGPFWVRGGKVGATVIEVADHIDHVKQVAGIDHVGKW